jgi:hypothetical protein
VRTDRGEGLSLLPVLRAEDSPLRDAIP